MQRGPGHYFWLAGAGAGLLALAIAALALTPSPTGHGTHCQLGFPPCLAIWAFGVPCPGCGVTTSVVLAAHGELAASLANQPFGFAVFLGVVAFAIWALVAQLTGRDLSLDARHLNRAGVWIPVAVLLLAAWVYKLASML
jgi:hypothetical protein